MRLGQSQIQIRTRGPKDGQYRPVYTGDLDAEMPRQKREVIFGRGELTRAVLDELRGAPGPLTSREIAQAVVALSGQDAIVIGDTLRNLRDEWAKPYGPSGKRKSSDPGPITKAISCGQSGSCRENRPICRYSVSTCRVHAVLSGRIKII